MEKRIVKRYGLVAWVALLSILSVGGMFLVSTAQDTLTEEITTQIKAAAYDPDVAAMVVRDAVAQAPDQALVIIRAATEAAPHLAITLTVAAVVPAIDQVEPIRQAAANTVPQQARMITLAAAIATQVISHPELDTEIVAAAIRETPGSSTTVVTAAATVCRFVTGCSPTSPMPIVTAAIAADQQAAEGIVEATVSLFPEAAGEIIAAATYGSAAAELVRQRAEPMAAEAAPDQVQAPEAINVVRAEPSIVTPDTVAENTRGPIDTDVVLPPAPVLVDFPSPTPSGIADPTSSGIGTGSGSGTGIIFPDLPPVFPASPFF